MFKCRRRQTEYLIPQDFVSQDTNCSTPSSNIVVEFGQCYLDFTATIRSATDSPTNTRTSGAIVNIIGLNIVISLSNFCTEFTKTIRTCAIFVCTISVVVDCVEIWHPFILRNLSSFARFNGAITKYTTKICTCVNI